MCAMATILFLGGWLPPFPVAPFTWIPGVIWFVLKCLFMFFLFAMVKAIGPRNRYDQLMRLGWKVFLPLSLAMVAIVAGVLQYRGLIGAVIGTVVAALVYVPLVTVVERGMRSRANSAAEGDILEQEISLLRRAVLAADLIVFAGIGYWLGGENGPYGTSRRGMQR